MKIILNFADKKEKTVYSIIVIIIFVIGIVVIISKKDTFLKLAWGSMKIILNFADKKEKTKEDTKEDKTILLQSVSCPITSLDLNMRYVAAALLASLGGNEVTADSIKAILSSVGVESDDKTLAIVVKQLAGKSVEELVAEGLPKLASMGGGGGAAPAAAAAGGEAAAAAPAAEEKKKEESEEEEDDDMGFGLFD